MFRLLGITLEIKWLVMILLTMTGTDKEIGIQGILLWSYRDDQLKARGAKETTVRNLFKCPSLLYNSKNS